MGQVVKLTVRLPRRLHARLQREASQSRRSLNALIVEALSRGAAPSESASATEAVRGVLARSGMLAETVVVWPGAAGEAQVMSHTALRELMAGADPLSETILADRGPR